MPASTPQTIGFPWNEVGLAGSLHLPAGGGPHPGVLMLQGSGPSDRDSGGYFVPIREAFLARGIAVFSFDKPGCGASTGDWRDHGLADRADQAIAALEVLRAHSAVDADRVGIWGQSQGGWLVQLIASRPVALAFAIANSGPSIDLPAQNLYGCEHSMRADGQPEAAIDAALAFIRRIHDAAERDDDYETVAAEIVRPVENESWYDAYLTIDGPEDWYLLRRFVGEGYEPRAALGAVSCPFLAIYGALDVLLPAWRGAEDSGRALHEAPTGDATVVVVPDGDHRIQDPASGEFVTGYLDLLADWAAARVDRSGVSGRP